MALIIECVAPSLATSAPPALRTSVQVKDSQFEPSTEFSGIQRRHPGNPHNYYYLRSWVDKTSGKITHQFFVFDVYISPDWLSWGWANSEDAQPLEFDSMYRHIAGCFSNADCARVEVFGAYIPDTMLKVHQDGFSVKFYAKMGKEIVITLTSQQIQQQLKAIGDFQASKK